MESNFYIIAGVAILNLITSILVVRLSSKTKTYQEKLGQYKADLDYLPKLTHEVERIKNEFSEAQNLKINIKSFEREMIFNMIDSLAKAYNQSISCVLRIGPPNLAVLESLMANHLMTLQELVVSRAKFKAICQDKQLIEQSADLQNYLIDDLLQPLYILLSKLHNNYRKISQEDNIKLDKPNQDNFINEEAYLEEMNKHIDQLKRQSAKINAVTECYKNIELIKNEIQETIDSKSTAGWEMIDKFLLRSSEYLRGLLS